MVIKNHSKHILLVDDELSGMTWMIDFLRHNNFLIDFSSNANEAYELVRAKKYDAAIIDLNIPLTPPLDAISKNLDPVYLKFPGLLVAREARNRGHKGKQTIIYTVHREAEIKEISEKLGCTYITKGRPIEIKDELIRILFPENRKKSA